MTQQENLAAFRAKARELVAVRDAAAAAYADATATFDAALLKFLTDSGAAVAEYVGNRLRIHDEGLDTDGIMVL